MIDDCDVNNIYRIVQCSTSDPIKYHRAAFSEKKNAARTQYYYQVEEIIADADDVPNLTFKMMKSQLESHFDVPLADRKSELIDILAEAMPSP